VPWAPAPLVEEYVDKGFLCSLAAHRAGLRTMWHRVETMDPARPSRSDPLPPGRV